MERSSSTTLAVNNRITRPPQPLLFPLCERLGALSLSAPPLEAHRSPRKPRFPPLQLLPWRWPIPGKGQYGQRLKASLIGWCKRAHGPTEAQRAASLTSESKTRYALVRPLRFLTLLESRTPVNAPFRSAIVAFFFKSPTKTCCANGMSLTRGAAAVFAGAALAGTAAILAFGFLGFTAFGRAASDFMVASYMRETGP